MSISTTKRRNEEVNVGLSNSRKAEITAQILICLVKLTRLLRLSLALSLIPTQAIIRSG